MKKLLKINIIAIIGILAFALPAMAATTASIAPDSINVKSGNSFSVAVSVNPSGTANFAEKIEVKFPADMIEVSSFTLGSNWMAMTQSGYDSVDNTNGVIVKTAGYPGGISTLTNFGTITFKAKKAGTGKIKVGNGSLAFTSGSQTSITGNESSFTIIAPVVTIPVKTIKKTTTNTTAPTSIATSTDEVDELITPISSEENPLSQSAAVVTSIPTKTSGNSWIWIIIVLAIVIIVYIVYSIFKKKKDNI